MGKLVKVGSTYYKIKVLAFLIGYQFFTIHQGTLPIFLNGAAPFSRDHFDLHLKHLIFQTGM